jgi:hypothetical protein
MDLTQSVQVRIRVGCAEGASSLAWVCAGGRSCCAWGATGEGAHTDGPAPLCLSHWTGDLLRRDPRCWRPEDGAVRRLLGAKPIGVLVIGAALLLGVVACGQGDEDGIADVEAGRPAGFEATPEYLAAVEDLEVVSHRFDMTIRVGVEMDGDVSDPDASRLTGAFDGERQYVRMDIGRLAGSGDGGRRMEQIVDIPGNALYVRRAYLAEVTETMSNLGATMECVAALGELGDRWGRADLTALADVLPVNWRSQLSQPGLQYLDPSAFLDLVAGAESVEELGTAEVQGEPMTGLATTVTAADISEAPGTNTRVTGPTAGAESGALSDLLAGLEYKLEVWIDRDGHVRRLVMDQGEAMEQIFEETDTPGSNALTDFMFILRLDLFDYEDESIQVEVPDTVDTVDITAALRGIYEPPCNP